MRRFSYVYQKSSVKTSKCENYTACNMKQQGIQWRRNAHRHDHVSRATEDVFIVFLIIILVNGLMDPVRARLPQPPAQRAQHAPGYHAGDAVGLGGAVHQDPPQAGGPHCKLTQPVGQHGCWRQDEYGVKETAHRHGTQKSAGGGGTVARC